MLDRLADTIAAALAATDHFYENVLQAGEEPPASPPAPAASLIVEAALPPMPECANLREPLFVDFVFGVEMPACKAVSPCPCAMTQLDGPGRDELHRALDRAIDQLVDKLRGAEASAES